MHQDGSIWFTDPTYGIRGNYEGFKSEQETKEAVYRVDPQTRQVAKVTDDQSGPNGVCFSPDYKKLYVADTGAGRDIKVYDVEGKTLKNGKRLVAFDNPTTGGPSYADGTRIGMIRLPETCANVCFGGSRRNRLFMAASESLYAVYVETLGAHFA